MKPRALWDFLMGTTRAALNYDYTRQQMRHNHNVWGLIMVSLGVVGVGIWVARRFLIANNTPAQDAIDQIGWLFMLMGALAGGRCEYWRGYDQGADWEEESELIICMGPPECTEDHRHGTETLN